MPVYQYIERGHIVERVLPVNRRDEFPGRIPVPARVLVCPSGVAPIADRVQAGFYAVEQKPGGLDELRRECDGMSVDQIKETWAEPLPA
jgi:hypothetical protein